MMSSNHGKKPELHQFQVGYTEDEERAHAWTHGLGVGFILIAGPLLVAQGTLSSWLLLSLVVYSLSFLLVFSASTLYHRARHPGNKQRLKKLDHIAIYVFIAGTNTPFLMGMANSGWSQGFLLFMWSLVVIGAVYKLMEIKWPGWVSLTYYLIMGWLGVVTMYLVYTDISTTALQLLIIGGLLYTIGAFFYHRDFIKWYHTIWHVFVLLAAITHYIAIWLQVDAYS